MNATSRRTRVARRPDWLIVPLVNDSVEGQQPKPTRRDARLAEPFPFIVDISVWRAIRLDDTRCHQKVMKSAKVNAPLWAKLFKPSREPFTFDALDFLSVWVITR
jgi:hypothetical protein